MGRTARLLRRTCSTTRSGSSVKSACFDRIWMGPSSGQSWPASDHAVAATRL
jgi:hypothetical protein